MTANNAATEDRARIKRIMLDLLRVSLGDSAAADWISPDMLDGDTLNALYQLSAYHDVAQNVAAALKMTELLPKDASLPSGFEKQLMVSMFRYEKLIYTQSLVCRTLGELEIPHIPLKGAVIRRFYPQPYMRTSCDFDVLVPEHLVGKAVNALEASGFVKECKERHDISMYSSDGVHLELHFALSDPEDPLYCEGLNKVWQNGAVFDSEPFARGDGGEAENAVSSGGGEAENAPFQIRSCAFRSTVNAQGIEGKNRYTGVLCDRYFYWYHIAHMAKHFKQGGCGIRPFLDLWLLKRGGALAEETPEALDGVGLKDFAEAAEMLTRVWFDGEEHTPVTEEMESFLLAGGLYGSEENRVAVKTAEKGRGGYVFGRIFKPYDYLVQRYNSLEGKRWLTPVYQVRRWIDTVFGGGLKRGAREVGLIRNADPEQTKRTSELMNRLGL